MSKTYDCVVKLACPYLSRDCQLEIISMLIPNPLPPSLFRKRSDPDKHQGISVKLLPIARTVRQTPGTYRPFTVIENELFELRAFDITFYLSDLYLNANQDCLFYFICACGSEENYDKFIDLSTFRSNQRQAFYLALKYGNIKLISHFLKLITTCRNDFTKDLCTLILHYAAEFGYLKIIRTLVQDFQYHPGAGRNLAIKTAAQKGHVHVMKYLLKEVDAKYEIDPAAAIQHAASNGHVEVVKYLNEEVDAKYGIDPTAVDNWASKHSASNGHLHVVKY